MLSGEKWPTPAQEDLLRATLLDGDEAGEAWERWRSTNDIELVETASSYLFPLLYLALRERGVSGPELAKLRGIHRFTWVKNQRLLRALVEVTRLFDEAGIATVVLKGAPLLLFHYKNIGARMMNDVDVMIDEVDFRRASELLSASGWSFLEPLPAAGFLPFTHAVPWSHPHFAEVDLHWRPFLIDSPPLAEQALRRRAVTRVVQGREMSMPDATDLLLLACVHGRKPDLHSGCRWVADAFTVIRTAEPAIQWDSLFERARALGVLLPARDALTYVSRLFDDVVPEDWLARAWAIPDSATGVRRYHQLLHESRANRRISEVLRTLWWRYSSGCTTHHRRRTPVGFASFFLSHYQRVWRLPSRRHVPLRAAAELRRYVASSQSLSR